MHFLRSSSVCPPLYCSYTLVSMYIDRNGIDSYRIAYKENIDLLY